MKGKVDILANFPIDTSLKKKTHSAMAGGQTEVSEKDVCGQDLFKSFD